jgi:cell division protein FtsB
MKLRIINKTVFIKIFIIISLSLYFFYYCVYGKFGLLQLSKIKKNALVQELTKNKVLLKVKEKEQSIKSLRPESLDLDFLDEKIRESVGFIKKNEIVIEK